MKIAQVIGTYEYGGIGTIITRIASELQKLGHEVEIVCIRKRLQPKDVRVVSFQTKLKPTILWGTLKMLNYLKRFDIVHIHGSLPIIFALFKRKNQKVIYTHHGWHIGVKETELKTKIGSALFLKIYQLVSSRIDAFIGISKWSQKEIKLFFGRDSYLLRNPVDEKKFKPRKVKKFKVGNPMILSVGRNRPHKGHKYEIIAMKDVIKKFPNANLVIVGEELEKLVPLVKRLNLSKNVTFLGKVDEKKLIRLYNSADVYITASFWELFGLTLLESIFCGTPVIARRAFAMTEIVEESKAGKLFTKNHEIPSVIIDVILNKQRLRKNALKYREEYLKYYSWERYAKKLEKIYRG